MNWSNEWQALSSRIKGLLDAATFFYLALHHSSEDARSVKKKVLLPEAENIVTSLKAFSERYKLVLPEIATFRLKEFLEKPEFGAKDFFAPTTNYEVANLQFALTSLAAFQAEFNYIIADTQFIMRRITERAFVHLQRCIIVDEDFRRKWITAFERRETECEKLGALHLLSHGAWAFKVDALGGRTDLILNEPLAPMSLLERSADALVLTEWKLVKDPDLLEDKIQEALKQAEIYVSTVIGGIELRNYRYLIMVSEGRMKMPDEISKGGINYRNINIAVNPGNPSKDAR
jgi:hypothetical protein